MIGILVFTNKQVLDHKLKDGRRKSSMFCFWKMKRFPRKIEENINEEIRLYMAIKGKIQGYFLIDDFDIYENGSGQLNFHSEEWHPIKDGEELKPSQGWRYYDG